MFIGENRIIFKNILDSLKKAKEIGKSAEIPDAPRS